MYAFFSAMLPLAIQTSPYSSVEALMSLEIREDKNVYLTLPFETACLTFQSSAFIRRGLLRAPTGSPRRCGGQHPRVLRSYFQHAGRIGIWCQHRHARICRAATGRMDQPHRGLFVMCSASNRFHPLPHSVEIAQFHDETAKNLMGFLPFETGTNAA